MASNKMNPLKHFIRIRKDKYSLSDIPAKAPSGDYLGGAAYQTGQVKKRGKAVCKTCGKIMHNTPKGWADECYECTSKRDNG